MGQKEYYLDNDKATADIREAFKKHVVKMFQLFGFSKGAATKKMQNIMKVETALAKVSKSRTELRDPEANYNKMTLQEFEAKSPAGEGDERSGRRYEIPAGDGCRTASLP